MFVCIPPGKVVPKMTYTMSGRMLNPTHSLTHLCFLHVVSFRFLADGHFGYNLLYIVSLWQVRWKSTVLCSQRAAICLHRMLTSLARISNSLLGELQPLQFLVLYVYISSRSRVYVGVTRHNQFYIVMKRAYSMTALNGVFCLGMDVINRPEPCFNHHASLEWDYGQL